MRGRKEPTLEKGAEKHAFFQSRCLAKLAYPWMCRSFTWVQSTLMSLRIIFSDKCFILVGEVTMEESVGTNLKREVFAIFLIIIGVTCAITQGVGERVCGR